MAAGRAPGAENVCRCGWRCGSGGVPGGAEQRSLLSSVFRKTENEMRKKLAEQGFSPASVEDAVLFLKHYRYLDDEDYARRYVEKNDHKKSIRQMKFDLRQKGVSDDLVEMVFEDMEVDESAQILGLLRKKNYDPEEPDPAKRQKIYAFLARKGFSYDAINSAMKQWE